MNGHRIKIKAPSRKNSQPIEAVRFNDYTYNPWDSIGLGYSSNVYLGHHVSTSNSFMIQSKQLL